MIYSGIDWSGDVGDPGKGDLTPWLVFVVVHIDGPDLKRLEEALGEVRRARQLSDDFVFKHTHTAPGVSEAFFVALGSVPFVARALVVDRRAWPPSYYRSRGYDRINHHLATLLCACPRELIAGGVVLVDQPRHETAAVRRTAAVLKRALSGTGVQPLPQIKPWPDHRSQGLIVQVADMLAGALRRTGGVIPAELRPVERRLTLMGDLRGGDEQQEPRR